VEADVGFTKDLWTSKVIGPDSKVTRERTARWGKGKRWLAVWHDEHGHERSKSFPVKASADKYWQAMETDVARGDYIDPKVGKEKVQAIGSRWLKSRRVDPQSAILYERAWRLHVEPAFGRRAVASIKPSEVQQWLAQLGEQYEESTLVTAYLVLQGLLELAIADGQRRDNPARAPVVDKPSSQRRGEKLRAWPDEVINAIIDCHSGRLRLVPVIMAGCGLRINEALVVGEGDFDFAGHVLHVRRQIKKLGPQHIFALPKNDSEREVPLPSWVEVIARQHLRRFGPQPVTLPWEKATGSPVTVQLPSWRDDNSFIRYRDYSEYVWKPALVHAKVIPPPQGVNRSRKPAFTTTRREGPHQLRHYYASVILGDGGSIVDLALYLGHHDPAVTLRTYGHMHQNSHERARAIIDARMFRPRAVSGGDPTE
jgi:integrase